MPELPTVTRAVGLAAIPRRVRLNPLVEVAVVMASRNVTPSVEVSRAPRAVELVEPGTT